MERASQAVKIAREQGHRREIQHDVSGNCRQFIYIMRVKSKAWGRIYSQSIARRMLTEPIIYYISKLGFLTTC